MSGYLTVPNEALVIARRNPELAGAILLLYADADADRWAPFECADRWLSERFSLSSRQARRLVALLVDDGLLEIVRQGDEHHARKVCLVRPDPSVTRAKRSPKHTQKRNANRYADGSSSTLERSEAHSEAHLEAHDEANEYNSSTPAQTTPAQQHIVEHDPTPTPANLVELPRPASTSLERGSSKRAIGVVLWQALMTLYVESGHGKHALELDGDRPTTLLKCLSKLHVDKLEAAKRMVHLLAYWLYGPNDFWRTHRKGSQLIGTLLRPTEIGVRYFDAESWVFDGVVRDEAGATTSSTRRESGYERQMRELQRQIDEEEAQHGDEEGHHASGAVAEIGGLLRPTPRA